MSTAETLIRALTPYQQAHTAMRRPALLLLDEATSALDNENEQRIRDSLTR